MTPDELVALQQRLGLSDNRMAQALGVTRQTWRNWRTGRAFPPLARNAVRWLMELRRLSPSNDNLPERLRFMSLTLIMGLAVIGLSEVAA